MTKTTFFSALLLLICIAPADAGELVEYMENGKLVERELTPAESKRIASEFLAIANATPRPTPTPSPTPTPRPHTTNPCIQDIRVAKETLQKEWGVFPESLDPVRYQALLDQVYAEMRASRPELAKYPALLSLAQNETYNRFMNPVARFPSRNAYDANEFYNEVVIKKLNLDATCFPDWLAHQSTTHAVHTATTALEWARYYMNPKGETTQAASNNAKALLDQAINASGEEARKQGIREATSAGSAD